MRKLIFAVLALCAMSAAQSKSAAPDQIFINGVVYIGTAKPSRAQAIAIRGERIIAVGTTAQISKLAGKETKVVDLGGKFVAPGFNDAHCHLSNGGFEKLNVNLIGTKSLEEMLSRVEARAKSAGQGEWVVGRGWDHTKWTKQVLPSRQDLDKVSHGHPAIFTRVDGHILVANSAALKAAGIEKGTKPVQGGAIDFDKKGEPTGIVRETAMSAVWRPVPNPSNEQRRKAVELAFADAAEHGITSTQDNSGWDDFLVYEQMQKEGKLTLRISEWLPFDNTVDQLKQMRAHHDAKDEWLHTGMLKGFMDGSLGSGTAALLAPYADNHESSGLPRYTQDQLDKMAVERADAGFQMGFHAIGDRGVDMALNAFEKANHPELRMRVEHVQVVAPQHFDRFKKLNVIASMQANHLLTDLNWAEKRLGPERAKLSYPWAQFLHGGVHLAFGTDYPVEPITPFRGIYSAVTRKNEEGTKTYYPEQKLTIDEAIAAYTSGAAYAEFAEKDKGTLEAGKLADFVVLDRDLTKIEPAEILKTKVVRTVVGGKTVYPPAM
jgi:predicted amidohydrolase YtcJ